MAAGSADRLVIDLRAHGTAIGDVLQGDALAVLEKRVLPGYIAARRWYAAKSTATPNVEIAETVPVGPPEDRAVLAIVRVFPPDQPTQLYLLPLKAIWPAPPEEMAGAAIVARLRHGAEEGVLIDALADDGFVRALVAAIRRAAPEGTTQASGHASGLLFRGTSALAEVPAAQDRTLVVERAEVEQSNTSLRLGGTMILKVFRRLEPGIHPELEMTRFLTEVAGFRHVPAFLGSIERTDAAGTPTALCVLQALVPSDGDGWSWVLSHLRRTLADGGGAADRDALNDALLPLIRRLGQRTAELHHALAIPTGDPAFTPEPVGAEDLEDWTEAVRTMARSVLNRLEQTRPKLAGAERGQADRLLKARSDLLSRIDNLPPVTITAMRTRLHGDYHLGQVLVVVDDVSIIDFEGEPMRPLAARRAKHSPLRDVAGMLRSFFYAAAAAARELPPGLPRERRATLAAALAAWEREAAAAFRDAYREAIQGCPSYPADPDHAERLLRLFLLEKALYEIGYELDNRPDWVGIPLAGILALLDEPEIPPDLSPRALVAQSRLGLPPGPPPPTPA